MSTTNKIRQHLESGKTITPIEALDLFGCFRLGARIYDLKQQGVKIITKRIERGGKHYAQYQLG